MYATQKIVDLLKSGNFTIAYHDNGHCCLYEGKHEYENLPEKEFYDFDNEFNGYEPFEVSLLVKALGGTSTSI